MAKKKVAKNKPEEKEEEKKEKTKSSSKTNKELYWILGVMATLIIVFLAANSIFQSLNKFEYEGLTFTKDKFGKIPLFKYYYYYNPPSVTGMATVEPYLVNLYLRIDPRKNNIPVDKEIVLSKDQLTYISVNPEDLTQCEYSSVAISTLTGFYIANRVEIKSATPLKDLAEESNVVYATCETHPENSVIIIQAGDETKIERINRNCYEITINGCDDVLPATEKFIVQSIIDAKARLEQLEN